MYINHKVAMNECFNVKEQFDIYYYFLDEYIMYNFKLYQKLPFSNKNSENILQ